MATNQIYQQSEVVRMKMMPRWQTMKFNVMSDLFEKGEVQLVGERDYRIPERIITGGRAGAYDPQGGDMGRGSGPEGIVMLQSFFNAKLAFELTELQIKATANKGVAVENVFLQALADGYREFELYWDKWCHGNGTALLATAISTSGATATSYVMSADVGVRMLRRGQYVTVYDSTLATIKSAGVLQIRAMNTQARTITLSGLVPGAAGTDKLCFEGVSGASPAGPRGLKYWISYATSGYTASVNRATESQIISKSVDVTSGAETPEAVMALYDRILEDRGEVANELVALCSPSTRAAIYSNVMGIQRIDIGGTTAQVVDRLPKLKGRDVFMWGNMPHYVDIHQDTTITHVVAPSTWGKARLAPTAFFQKPGVSGPEGRFFVPYGASGAPAAGLWFAYTKNEDLYTVDPGAQGLIYNLTTPTLYA